VLEEMVYRERVRTWKTHYIDVLSVAAKTSGSMKLLTRVGAACDDLLGMVMHTDGAYSLSDRPPEEFEDSKSDSEMLAMMDEKIADV
jgi:hypothetical protein